MPSRAAAAPQKDAPSCVSKATQTISDATTLLDIRSAVRLLERRINPDAPKTQCQQERNLAKVPRVVRIQNIQ